MLVPIQPRYLELITPSGTIAARAFVQPPSLSSCGPDTAAVLQPPVSATKDKVFYRSGNIKIKYLTPDGKTGDATTVQGSPTKVSFFSVSPDDKRIAVLLEDFSAASTISLTLYVEDLKGGGHHSVIYRNKVPKSATATTLWPMGWHKGNLVLAVVPACSLEPANAVPTEWHVSSAATGLRLATIGKNHCTPSYWPSPTGVLCIDETVDNGGLGVAYVINLAGKVIASVQTTLGQDFYSGLSPSGATIFTSAKAGAAPPAPLTKIVTLGTGLAAAHIGHSACLWIDESHLLAPDAVIAVQTAMHTATPTPTPVATPTGVSPTATPREEFVMTTSVISLPARASAVCVGRFPGGL
jgi:hypothetical protein